jgi:Mycotoxin biosynthesis protein UstYa
MCTADTTMEPARYRGRDGVVRTAHGWGVEHQCKNWGGVWEWAMEHHAHDNRTGIL